MDELHNHHTLEGEEFPNAGNNSGPPIRASSVAVSVGIDGPTAIYTYQVDTDAPQELCVTYPFLLSDADQSQINAAGIGVGVFVGQLTLAKVIRFEYPVSPGTLEAARPLAKLLYDVRCLKDRRALLPPPTLAAVPGIDPILAMHDVAPRRACLLWSGGKDSTLAAILLRNNRFEVRALHATVNAGVESSEATSVIALGNELDLNVDHLKIHFPGLVPLAARYSRKWNDFPRYNRVPFGRDMLLALLSTPYVRRTESAYISMGHDHDCKVNEAIYEGQIIPRNDVESIRGALALETFIREAALSNAALLPPLAGLPEFRILYEMLVKYPRLMSMASFCFWGSNCGRCPKCLRYYLAQRVLCSQPILEFRANPLAGDNCPELLDFIEDWRNESALFRDEVFYCLSQLVRRGDIGENELLLHRFRDHIYPHIYTNLDVMEQRILQVYLDPQLPRDFEYPPLLGSVAKSTVPPATGGAI